MGLVEPAYWQQVGEDVFFFFFSKTGRIMLWGVASIHLSG